MLRPLGCPNRSCFVIVCCTLSFLFGCECERVCSISEESGISLIAPLSLLALFPHFNIIRGCCFFLFRNDLRLMNPFLCVCVDGHACGCACMSVSLHVYVSPGRLCAAIAGVDYSTWPDGFGLGTTGRGYVSPLCPRRQLTLIILSANGRLNLLPLSLLVICIHVSHPKNSKVTKRGYYSFLQSFFLFW